MQFRENIVGNSSLIQASIHTMGFESGLKEVMKMVYQLLSKWK